MVVLMTSRKPLWAFDLYRIANQMNDLERRIGRILRYSTEFGSFGANFIKTVENRPILSGVCNKNVVPRIVC